ncbi:MAG: shikimate kinase [Nitrospina sp.]|nr:shikimate kinase [Nitrospina sp.]
MNIVLIGYRGTGKSVVGRILARLLNRPLYSLDRIIESKGGMRIPEFVARNGWPRFRELESEVVCEVCAKAEEAILDCGGGVVLDHRNVERLKEQGRMVLLTAGFEILLKRLSRDRNRPALMEGVSFEEEQKLIMTQREAKYREAADFTCDTTQDTPEETANEIVRHFRESGWV